MKLTREEVLGGLKAIGFIIAPEDESSWSRSVTVNIDTLRRLIDHFDKPLAESAVASHECGSVPDERSAVAARLDALLPELIYSRETHAQWRDCEQICRDRNPQIGDAKFHAQAVLDYDERIAAITEAAALIRSGMQPPNNQPNSVDLPLLTVFAKAITTIAHTTNHCSDEYTRLSETARLVMEEVLPQACKLLGTQCFITMQHNQPNSDHVAVIGAKPDSVHLAVTSAGPESRVEPASYIDYQQRKGAPLTFFTSVAAQAYAAAATRDDVLHIDAMRVALQAVEDAQSGISSPTYRPNEQNDVVREGKQ